MQIAFYYPGYDPYKICGTKDAIDLVAASLRRFHGHSCDVFGLADGTVPTRPHPFNKYDVVVCVTSNTGLPELDTTTVLWNHCWDFVEGMADKLDCFDLVMGLSEMHAQNLGVKHWCPGAVDTEVFYRTDTPKQPDTLFYCGGPFWWKGAKVIPAIRSVIEPHGYRIHEGYNLNHWEIAAIFNASQYVLIPSEIESFCLVSVQAQACGCIPIAHDCGGIRATLPERYVCCAYSPNTGEAVLRTLKQVEGMPDIEEAMIENSKRFSEEKTAKQFDEILRAL